MKIAVMGAGGMGGWLGAKLAAAGNEIAFIARGAHLEAMRTSGLSVSGAETLRLAHVAATDNPGDIGPVDVILFCVKLYDTESAARALVPLLGPKTFVITVQNGVESADRIGQIIGDGRTLAGAAYFPANIAAPGEIAYVGRIEGKPHIAFGEPGDGPSERAQEFAGICRAAGIDTEVFDDTESMIWEKFCLIAGTSAATALTRQTVGVVRSDQIRGGCLGRPPRRRHVSAAGSGSPYPTMWSREHSPSSITTRRAASLPSLSTWSVAGGWNWTDYRARLSDSANKPACPHRFIAQSMPR